MSNSIIYSGFKASLGALFGYVALGLSFGFLFQKAGADWYLAPLMSLIVYAGAAQFVAVALLVSHGPLSQILSATFFINLRHIFYGISFLGKFPKNKFLKKMYMIFGLTDESYSILTSTSEEYNETFSFYVILFSHFYWVLGSLLGAFLGMYLTANLSYLEFTLPELFVILSVEQAYATKNAWPFLIAFGSSIFALWFYPSQMLLIAILLSTLIIAICYMLTNKFSTTNLANQKT